MELTCIVCPLGCRIETNETGEAAGALCDRGRRYASDELENPVRAFSTTVPVTGGGIKMLPVKTAGKVPKAMLFECLAFLAGVEAAAPVEIGDVVVADICGTGTDIVAARRVEAAPC